MRNEAVQYECALYDVDFLRSSVPLPYRFSAGQAQKGGTKWDSGDPQYEEAIEN